jgi:hypothetical protein
MDEAYAVGMLKLKLERDIINKARDAATEMEVKPAHMGPMTLALALMGVAKATDPKELSGELTDALALVSRAEAEWRADQMARRMN